MANTIQIKRSVNTATPSSLAAGELAYSENSLRLYVGEADSTVRVIGGEGAFLRSDENDTFNGNLVVTGNLTVQGTTTTVESNTISVGDNIIELNNDASGAPTEDAGIEVNRGTSDAAQWIWDESNDYWRPKVGTADADLKGINDLGVNGNSSLVGDLAVDGTSNLDDTDIDGTLVVDGSNISLDSTSTLNIDNSNTTNGVTIATATSGVPVTIGHATSEVTFGDNITVTGNATIGDNLLPDSNGGATIGASTSRFTNGYFLSGDVNSLTVNTGASIASLAVGDLTSGRVILAGSGGELEDSSNLTFNGTTLTTSHVNIGTEATLASAIVSDLTATRITFAGTSGALVDNADLTYTTGTSTLAVSNVDVGTQAALASAAIEDLTSGRVVLAGTGGEIEDSANLTFNGTTLAVTGNATVSADLTVSGAFTSQGIDDNATTEVVQIDNTNVKIMATGVTLGGYSSGTKSVMDNFVIDGGTF